VAEELIKDETITCDYSDPCRSNTVGTAIRSAGPVIPGIRLLLSFIGYDVSAILWSQENPKTGH